MSDEKITQTTRYVRAVEEVAKAARRVEEVRVKYENTMDAFIALDEFRHRLDLICAACQPASDQLSYNA